MLDPAKLGQFVGQIWGDSIVPPLVDYIRIPNKSPAFDPDWASHGHMEEAVAMFERWACEQLAGLPGATLHIVRLPGRTPLILIEGPGGGAWIGAGDPAPRRRQALRPRRRRRWLRDVRGADRARRAARTGRPVCA